MFFGGLLVIGTRSPSVRLWEYERLGTPPLAEERGSRTHQARLTRLSGFEDRASHRAAMLLHTLF
jgi:hypothetical protein